jgi:hypothetical protein
MPEATRKGVEDIKKGEIDKRKKVWEDKEGPPTKKQKKMTPAQEERGIHSILAFFFCLLLTGYHSSEGTCHSKREERTRSSGKSRETDQGEGRSRPSGRREEEEEAYTLPNRRS